MREYNIMEIDEISKCYPVLCLEASALGYRIVIKKRSESSCGDWFNNITIENLKVLSENLIHNHGGDGIINEIIEYCDQIIPDCHEMVKDVNAVLVYAFDRSNDDILNRLPLFFYYFKKYNIILITISSHYTHEDIKKSMYHAQNFFRIYGNGSTKKDEFKTILFIQNYWKKSEAQFDAFTEYLSFYGHEYLFNSSMCNLIKLIKSHEKKVNLIFMAHCDKDDLFIASKSTFHGDGMVEWSWKEEWPEEDPPAECKLYKLQHAYYMNAFDEIVPKINCASLFTCYGGNFNMLSHIFFENKIPCLSDYGEVNVLGVLELIKMLLL